MKKRSPDRLAAMIFGAVGGGFLALGLVFLAVSRDLLPRLFEAALWELEELPDEMALPLVGLIFAGMGAAFLLVAGGLLWSERRRERLRAELRAWGTRVTGTVEAVKVDYTLKVNGRSPYRVHVRAEHPATRQTVTVRSSQVWTTALKPGDAVDVLFDPMNEKRHFVELPQE